jgi:hypothetical protein
LKKSKDSYIYTREVQKLSTIFSYIGGVVSSFITVLFLLNKYNSFAFEIAIANQIFKLEKKEKRNINLDDELK